MISRKYTIGKSKIKERSRRKKNKGVHDPATRIKVQLDHRTTMIVHSMNAFKMWKKRYPLAKVIA